MLTTANTAIKESQHCALECKCKHTAAYCHCLASQIFLSAPDISTEKARLHVGRKWKWYEQKKGEKIAAIVGRAAGMSCRTIKKEVWCVVLCTRANALLSKCIAIFVHYDLLEDWIWAWKIEKEALKSPFVPDDVHSAGSHFGIATHDGNAGSKRAVDAEDHKLCPSRDDGQVAVCHRVVAPRGQGRAEQPQCQCE